MGETGILAPDASVELIEGEIFDFPGSSPFHGGVNIRLNNYTFNNSDERRWIVSVRDPVHLDDYSEPRPDLMLLKFRPDYYVSRHPVPDDVLLLIEVADSSLEFDRCKKLRIYARAAIPEVWIINLQELVIEVYREPHFTGYEQKTICREGDKASPAEFPDVKVDVDKLLQKECNK